MSSDQIKSWNTDLFNLWQEENGREKVKQLLSAEIFPKTEDPFKTLLNFLSSGVKNPKWAHINVPKAESFNAAILEDFATWFSALEKAKKDEISAKCIKKPIEDLCNSRKFMLSSILITIFGIQENFSVKSALIPVALQRETMAVQKYLAGKNREQLRENFVVCSDELLGMSEVELNKFVKQSGATQTGRPQVVKLVKSYQKQYSIPDEKVPNLQSLCQTQNRPKTPEKILKSQENKQPKKTPPKKTSNASSNSPETSSKSGPNSKNAKHSQELPEDAYLKWISELTVISNDAKQVDGAKKKQFYGKMGTLLGKIYGQVDNPFRVGLILAEIAIQQQNYVLVRHVINGLKKPQGIYLNANGKEKFLEMFVTQDVQNRSITLLVAPSVRIAHRDILQTLIKLFYLDEALPSVISSHNYRNASYLITTFRVQDQYPIEAVLLPCFLQAKANAVSAYLAKRGDIRKELIVRLRELGGMEMEERVEWLWGKYGDGIPLVDFGKVTAELLKHLTDKILHTSLPIPSSAQTTPPPPQAFRTPKSKPNANPLPFPLFTALAPLSPANRLCLHLLEQHQRTGRDPSQFLDQLFDSSLDAFALALQLVENCTDFQKSQKGTKRISTLVFYELGVWAKKRKYDAEMLGEALKSRAFLTVILAKNTLYTPTVVEVYKLDTISPQMVMTIKALLEARFCRLAVQTITILGLQDTFAHPFLLVGCILQDGDAFVRNYLKGRQDMQIGLIGYIDALIENGESKDAFGHVFGWQRLKKWPKVVKKFCQIYSIPTSFTPNLQKQQYESAMNFLIMQRYKLGRKSSNKSDARKNQSDQSWNDCVRMMLEKRPELIEFLLKHLSGLRKFEEAAKWMQITGYEIHNNSPHLLVTHLRRNPGWMAKFLRRYKEPNYPLVTPGCAKLPQELFNGISMVDSQETLDEFMEFYKLEAEKEEQILMGLDSEWQPSFVYEQQFNDRTALLQVAFQKRIFLLDMVALPLIVTEEQWPEILEKLLCSKNNILRIGFDFGGSDMSSLRARVPFDPILGAKVDVLCLKKLFAQLTRSHPSLIAVKKQDLDQSTESDVIVLEETVQEVENGKESQENGETEETEPKEEEQKKESFSLSDAYEACFNVPLDKNEQLTDWERRPLRQSQKHYAAMDAYCQLEIYTHLKQKASEAGVDFDKIVRLVRFGVKETEKLAVE